MCVATRNIYINWFRLLGPKSFVSSPPREDKDSVYRFKNKIEWTRRPIEWEALEDFEDISDSNSHLDFIAGRWIFMRNGVG